MDRPTATLSSPQFRIEVTHVPQCPHLLSGERRAPDPKASCTNCSRWGTRCPHLGPGPGNASRRHTRLPRQQPTTSCAAVPPGPSPLAGDWRRRCITRPHRPMGTWSRQAGRGGCQVPRILPLTVLSPTFSKKEKKLRPGMHWLPFPEAPPFANTHKGEANDFIS